MWAVAVPGAYMFQIQITKTYNTTNLLEDIKGLYKIAGLKGQKVAFIFTCAACLHIYIYICLYISYYHICIYDSALRGSD